MIYIHFMDIFVITILILCYYHQREINEKQFKLNKYISLTLINQTINIK